MDFHKGGAAPLWGQMKAATAGAPSARRREPGTALRCDGSKHAATGRFQSLTRPTRQLAPRRHPTVQTGARLGSEFFTWATASTHPAACTPRPECDTPAAKACRGYATCERTAGQVTGLSIRCADSPKPGFNQESNTERSRP
ncbi:hypothetical protein GCM10009536_47050 [Streptomyces thermocarboxydus]